MTKAVKRIAMLTVHTSPTDMPGTGDGGGLNVYVRQVASRLARLGIAIDIYTRRSSETQPLSTTIDPGVSLHHLPVGPATSLTRSELTQLLPAFTQAVGNRLRTSSTDLVHSQYWLAGVVATQLRAELQLPFVHTFHTLGVLKNATLAPTDTPEPQLRIAAEREICRYADRLLVLTCDEARLLYQTYAVNGARMDVVPAGVDQARFSPVGNRRQGPREHASKLLFVGRLQPLKGPDIAIQTLAELRRTMPDATLTIVGGVSGNGDGVSGPVELAALAKRLAVTDAVTLVDAVPQAQLVAFYRDADLVLAPSRSETFGLVALEAQACGTPVVAAAVTGLRAVVGAAGALVDGHDPVDHAGAARCLLTDPKRWRAASEAGIAAANRSTWDHTAERLLRSYRSVLTTPFVNSGALTG